MTARPVTPVGIAGALVASARAVLADGDPAADREAALAALARAEAILLGLDDYCADLTAPASSQLEALADRTARVDWERHDGVVHLEQEMLTGHVEGALLGLLVRATGARRVLEIGMFTGYSTLAMAEALPADGEVVACELDPGVAAQAQTSFDASEAGHRIRIEVGPAAHTLGRLEGAGETFDLVFVDADKTGYVGYVEALLDGGLLRPGGLLVLDNTLMQGEPWAAPQPTTNGRAVDDVNRLLLADPRLTPVLLPVRDGVTLALRDRAAGEPGPAA